MIFKNSVFEYLSGKAAITSALGTPPRIYPDKAAQNTAKPYVTWIIINANHNNYILGSSGLVEALVQFDTWADSSASNKAASEALRNALAGFRNSSWGTGGNLTRIDSCMLQNEEESQEPPKHGNEAFLFRTRMTFRIWYRETIPTL